MSSEYFMVVVAFLFLIAISPNAFATCGNCGAGAFCRCPQGYCVCMGSHPTCEEACGLTPSGSGSGTPAVPSVQGAFMNGLMNGLVNSMQSQPRQMTPQEIEQERQAELARQQAEQRRKQQVQDYLQEQERAKQEKENMLDHEAQDAMALLGNPAQDQKKSEGYQKGFDHATQCISRNAGTSCSAGTAKETEACVADYNAGYESGSAKTKVEMQEAYLAGEAAGNRGEEANGAADSRATGGCRTQWVEAYNRGYFSAKHSK